MKLGKRISKIMLLYVMAIMLCIPSMTVYAETQVKDLSKLMITQKTLNAYAEPSTQSEITITYDAGASVLVTGETTDGWYRVVYQDKVGFVKKTDLNEADINTAALDEEFEANEIDGKIFVEEVERVRAQIARSRFWGIIIVVLVVGIFGTGIYSTIQNDRKLKMAKLEETEKDQTEERQSESIVTKNAVVKNKTTENVDDMIEPLSFNISKKEPLDIIDLDKQEL